MIGAIKKRFHYLQFFKGYLKERVFIIVVLNLLVGVLDGLGLSMFLPLLHLAGGTPAADGPEAGKFGFVLDWLEQTGLSINLTGTLLFITVFFVLKGIAYYFKGAYQVAAQQYFIKKIRLKSVKVLCELNYGYFTQADTGRIQNTLTTEIERVAKACQSYFQTFQHLILIGVYVSFAFLLNWKFALMVCLGGMIIDLLYRRIYKKTKGVSRQLTDGNSTFQGLIAEFMTTYKYLKATATILTYQRKLNRQISSIELNNRKIGILSVFLSASREPLSIVVLSAVILLQVSLLNVPFATILVSLLFFYRALSSLMQYQTAWNAFLSVAGSLENTDELVHNFEENKEISEGMPLHRLNRRIQLEDIRFGYNNKEVLRGVSLSIQKNEFIALVGPSGSGKSTLANLITGLLTPTAGLLRVDGFSMQYIDLTSYQQRIGYITQDPVIFNDTVFNNITLWAEKTAENLINFRKACEAAAIWSFVATQGEDQQLGTNGINLSGGQKQRMAMARELFKDVDLLIMDEATSAMDSHTEREIQESIAMLKGRVTIVCIAHRLSTVKNADRIIYLDQGRIVGAGNFAELKADSPGFRNMVELQAIS